MVRTAPSNKDVRLGRWMPTAARWTQSMYDLLGKSMSADVIKSSLREVRVHGARHRQRRCHTHAAGLAGLRIAFVVQLRSTWTLAALSPAPCVVVALQLAPGSSHPAAVAMALAHRLLYERHHVQR